jgi:hypothetical protein
VQNKFKENKMKNQSQNEYSDAQAGDGGYIWSSRIGCVGGKDKTARTGNYLDGEIRGIGCVGGK